MEAKRKTTVAERLAEFKAKYPIDKFIWVNSPPETMDEWPEHYGIGAKTFKVPTENFVSYTNPKTGKTSSSNGWLFELHGLYLLMKPAKLRIMQDAGIVPIPNSFRRLDDGTNSQVCGMEGAMGKLTVNGLQIARGEKWIDLNITKRVNAEYLVENCETKLELRLGWKLIALPQSFTMAELKAKEFVTFCIYQDFHATTPEEHTMILRHMLGIYRPAFPGATLPEGRTPKQLEAPKAETVLVPDNDEIEDVETIENGAAGADPEPPSIEDTPASVPAAPAEEPVSRPTVEKITFMQAMQDLKRRLVELLGPDGLDEYYGILHKYGHEHCNQITDLKEQKTVYRLFAARVELLEQNPPFKRTEKPKAPPEENDFLEYILTTRRKSFEKMEIPRIADHLDELMANCPVGKYPKDWKEIIESGDKARMIDLAVELIKINTLETKRLREAHNAKGGARS